MKKKLLSIFLSATLIFQGGVIPQTSAKHVNDGISSAVQSENSRYLNSQIVRALKYVGGTALVATGLYFVYKHFRPRPQPAPPPAPQPKLTQPKLTQTELPQTKPVAQPKLPQTKPVAQPKLPQTELPQTEPAASIDLSDIPLSSGVHSDPKAPALEQRITNFEATLNTYSEVNYTVPKNKINQICGDVTEILRAEPSLLNLKGPTIVVSDTHGNFEAIKYSIRAFLNEVGRTGISIIFLGDYVDRGEFAPGGPNSIKNVALLFELKMAFPDKVFLLRGNHEDSCMNGTNGFLDECKTKYGQNMGKNIWERFNETFGYLSLAAVVDNTTFCVHGGISPELHNLHQINDIKKPLLISQFWKEEDCGHHKNTANYNALASAVDLLWSDPCEGIIGFSENKDRDGAGKIFGHDEVKKFLKECNLKRIVRGHQQVNGHRDNFGDGSIITLFSAPDYYSESGNIGQIAKINGDNIDYYTVKY